MLRTLIFIIGFLLSSSFAFGQEKVDLTSYPWQVSSDSQQSDELVGMLGNKFYFYSNGSLLISTPKGSLLTKYALADGVLEIAGQRHNLEMDGEVLNLASQNGNRNWQLERAQVGIVVQEASPTKLGDFRLDGFYYRMEESDPVSYHYYRFYEDGEMLYFHSIIPPSEIETFLNKAYVSNEQEARGYMVMPATQLDSAATYEFVAVSLSTSEPEGEKRELLRVSTFLVREDSIYLSQTSQWNYSDRSFTQEYALAFAAFENTTSWTGQSLTPGEAGAAHELLPLPQIPEPEVILLSVDEMPRYPGCEDIVDMEERRQCAMNKMLVFLYSNIKYPAIARENGVEGTCVIRFIVEKDGRVSNARIVRDIGAGCGNESLRVVRIMQDQDTRWIPGMLYERPVRVEFSLPISFRLESRTREKKSRRRRN